MKYLLSTIGLIGFLISSQSCTKTESDFNTNNTETITISTSSNNVNTGTAVSFTVLSSINSNNVTNSSKIFVNGAEISGSSFTFNTIGTFAVFATKGSITSNVVTINVTAAAPIASFKHNVLVEEYSGNWCGNCPRILHAVNLLKQQTPRAIVVSTHLFGGDPLISSDGNALASQENITSVPSGRINKTTTWNGPHDQNVNQVINTIAASSNLGLAIKSSVMGSNLNVTINVGYAQALSGSAKLVVYILEDRLFGTQANYSANLFGGLSSIPNFQYNGVLRKAVSSLQGDVIPNSGADNAKDYTVNLPSNIANIANAKIVAFVLNSSGTVVNVQEAKIGEIKAYER
jgi:hypothetical protein